MPHHHGRRYETRRLVENLTGIHVDLRASISITIESQGLQIQCANRTASVVTDKGVSRTQKKKLHVWPRSLSRYENKPTFLPSPHHSSPSPFLPTSRPSPFQTLPPPVTPTPQPSRRTHLPILFTQPTHLSHLPPKPNTIQSHKQSA